MSENEKELGRTIATIIINGIGLVMLNVAAWHFGGIYGVIGLNGFMLRFGSCVK